MAHRRAVEGTPTPTRRRRVGKQSESGVNLWEENQDIETVFSDYHGAASIERIFEIFGDPSGEIIDISWFGENNKPNVVADPLNRPLQQSTVREYEERLLNSGLADDCSGILDLLFTTYFTSKIVIVNYTSSTSSLLYDYTI